MVARSTVNKLLSRINAACEPSGLKVAKRCLLFPGHGAAFTDVAGALQRARRRLAAHRAAPHRHARHAAKVLVKYHLMEELRQDVQTLLDWAETTPLLHSCQARAQEPGTPREFAERLLLELLEAGALRREGQVILDV